MLDGGPMISVKELGSLSKRAVGGWVEDRAASMGAALAYYTAFSIAPLLIIIITVAGLFFGRDAAQQAIIGEFQGLLGETGAAAISDILRSTGGIGGGIAAIVVGVAALLLGATTAFVELQDDLDRIWKAEPRAGGGIVNLIRSRLLSLGMVLLIGFLLTVSLATSAAVAALGDAMFADTAILLNVVTFVLSLAVVTVLFALIYKVLPNVDNKWENVWVGAAITAVLFEAGKFLIGLYIGKSSVASSFGAAGPFVVLMLWIYYSTQVFLLGAEFTYAHASRHDPRLRHDANARFAHAGAVPGATEGMATPSRATDLDGTAAGAARTDEGPPQPRWLEQALFASAAGLIAGFSAMQLIRRDARKRA
jgi:membrane protein